MKHFTTKNKSLLLSYTPHPYTPTPTFKDDRKRKISPSI